MSHSLVFRIAFMTVSYIDHRQDSAAGVRGQPGVAVPGPAGGGRAVGDGAGLRRVASVVRAAAGPARGIAGPAAGWAADRVRHDGEPGAQPVPGPPGPPRPLGPAP